MGCFIQTLKKLKMLLVMFSISLGTKLHVFTMVKFNSKSKPNSKFLLKHSKNQKPNVKILQNMNNSLKTLELLEFFL